MKRRKSIYQFLFWYFNDLIGLDFNIVNVYFVTKYKKECHSGSNWILDNDEIWNKIKKSFEKHFDNLLWDDIEYWRTH